ncbi:MAG: hypothetical protein CL917_10940 [Deltaproteobacteria bacterium]|nr:hypothetical protein [Deltaproteobacteria bacterium]
MAYSKSSPEVFAVFASDRSPLTHRVIPRFRNIFLRSSFCLTRDGLGMKAFIPSDSNRLSKRNPLAFLPASSPCRFRFLSPVPTLGPHGDQGG